MKTRQWFEGWLLCMGVGLYYLAADANDNGHTGWALWLFVFGSIFLIFMLILSVESTYPLKRHTRR